MTSSSTVHWEGKGNILPSTIGMSGNWSGRNTAAIVDHFAVRDPSANTDTYTFPLPYGHAPAQGATSYDSSFYPQMVPSPFSLERDPSWCRIPTFYHQIANQRQASAAADGHTSYLQSRMSWIATPMQSRQFIGYGASAGAVRECSRSHSTNNYIPSARSVQDAYQAALDTHMAASLPKMPDNDFSEMQLLPVTGNIQDSNLRPIPAQPLDSIGTRSTFDHWPRQGPQRPRHARLDHQARTEIHMPPSSSTVQKNQTRPEASVQRPLQPVTPQPLHRRWPVAGAPQQLTAIGRTHRRAAAKTSSIPAPQMKRIAPMTIRDAQTRITANKNRVEPLYAPGDGPTDFTSMEADVFGGTAKVKTSADKVVPVFEEHSGEEDAQVEDECIELGDLEEVFDSNHPIGPLSQQRAIGRSKPSFAQQWEPNQPEPQEEKDVEYLKEGNKWQVRQLPNVPRTPNAERAHRSTWFPEIRAEYAEAIEEASAKNLNSSEVLKHWSHESRDVTNVKAEAQRLEEANPAEQRDKDQIIEAESQKKLDEVVEKVRADTRNLKARLKREKANIDFKDSCMGIDKNGKVMREEEEHRHLKENGAGKLHEKKKRVEVLTVQRAKAKTLEEREQRRIRGKKYRQDNLLEAYVRIQIERKRKSEAEGEATTQLNSDTIHGKTSEMKKLRAKSFTGMPCRRVRKGGKQELTEMVESEWNKIKEEVIHTTNDSYFDPDNEPTEVGIEESGTCSKDARLSSLEIKAAKPGTKLGSIDNDTDNAKMEIVSSQEAVSNQETRIISQESKLAVEKTLGRRKRAPLAASQGKVEDSRGRKRRKFSASPSTESVSAPVIESRVNSKKEHVFPFREQAQESTSGSETIVQSKLNAETRAARAKNGQKSREWDQTLAHGPNSRIPKSEASSDNPRGA